MKTELTKLTGISDISVVITDSCDCLTGSGVDPALIDGVITGIFRMAGNVTISINSRITGELDVDYLSVYGSISGSLRVRKSVVFHPGSSFAGNLIAKDAEFVKGCRISGTQNIERITGEEILSPKRSASKSVLNEKVQKTTSVNYLLEIYNT